MSENLFEHHVSPAVKRIERDAFADGPRTASPPLAHRTAGKAERAAAVKAAPLAKPLRVLVLEWIRKGADEGLTAPELGACYAALKDERPSARREYAVRPRITELNRAGFIAVKPGFVREGCTVWVATDKPGDGSDVRTGVVRDPTPREALAVLVAVLDEYEYLTLAPGGKIGAAMEGARRALNRGEK